MTDGAVVHTISIRRARPEDAAALARLLAELGYPGESERVRERLVALDTPENLVLLALMESSPVGLLGIHRTPVLHADGPVAHITALVTAEAWRGRGVGRRLLAAAEAWAREHGCVRLTVTSAERRGDAHAFYPACGLPYTGRRFSKSLEG